ncbi:MAG: TIGR02147 family protein [Pseudomonadota bacterium]|nr:TIGR02147 family protein [Pseudomonadota bacterium]
MGAAKKIEIKKPDVFGYHDYREFLRDLFNYLKSRNSENSQRGIAKLASLSPGYLPLVLSGARSLTEKSLDKILPHIELKDNEKSFLRLLLILGESKSQTHRSQALNQIQKYHIYQNKNPKELETYRYLTKWYIVAIRELAATENFKADAKWIQSRLVHHVPLVDIERALEFLIEFKFLHKGQKGQYVLAQKNMNCLGGVFQIALADYHREMLSLAEQSIDKTDKEKRNLQGYTFPVALENISKVNKIIEEALAKIADLEGAQKKSEEVYHVSFSLFPLTSRVGHE